MEQHAIVVLYNHWYNLQSAKCVMRNILYKTVMKTCVMKTSNKIDHNIDKLIYST